MSAEKPKKPREIFVVHIYDWKMQHVAFHLLSSQERVDDALSRFDFGENEFDTKEFSKDESTIKFSKTGKPGETFYVHIEKKDHTQIVDVAQRETLFEPKSVKLGIRIKLAFE